MRGLAAHLKSGTETPKMSSFWRSYIGKSAKLLKNKRVEVYLDSSKILQCSD